MNTEHRISVIALIVVVSVELVLPGIYILDLPSSSGSTFCFVGENGRVTWTGGAVFFLAEPGDLVLECVQNSAGKHSSVYFYSVYITV